METIFINDKVSYTVVCSYERTIRKNFNPPRHVYTYSPIYTDFTPSITGTMEKDLLSFLHRDKIG